jgi:formylglycine-generating enzyme required for sulfatase activity
MTFAQAQQLQLAYAQEHHLPVIRALQLNLRVNMEFVLIAPGEFVMGSPEDTPPHHVRIPLPFYLARTPVTQAQWLAVVGSNPAHFQHDSELPVETITWEACSSFGQKLSSLTGYPARLPSEAEWEYACRAGSSTAYSYGDSKAALDQYGWYRDNANGTSHPVGHKKPNAWGLYDMHGGIDEFCQDVWHPNYEGAPADGSAWIADGEQGRRVLRGGSWYDLAEHCSSPHRNSYPAAEPSEDHGCRVVVSAQ